MSRQVELGPVDVVTIDFLAEITMSIMQKQRARDPRAGYARDFIGQVEQALPLLAERGTRVISNAGGVNPLGCRGALLEMAQRNGRPLEVAAVGAQWVRLSRGYVQTCAGATDGALYCWGQYTGAPFAATAPVPTRIESSQAFTDFSAGGTHACAIGADRLAYCWGRNAWGQVGQPPSDP